MQRHGSPFAAIFGGRVDSYGSSYGGNFQFWWALDTANVPGDRDMAWGPELEANGELRIRPQDRQTANYVRCVKE